MNIGEKIRFQRKLKHLTQEQLGKKIGVSKMMISKYERNIVDNMSRDKVKALSKILDIPVIDFLESSNSTNNKNKITKNEFYNEVKELLNKTPSLTDQEKQHFLSTLDFICSDDK